MAKGDRSRSEKPARELGVDLVGLGERWRAAFRAEMVRRGYPWHAGAAGDVLQHLTVEGVSQSTLPQRMGITKQAVQQLLDRLVAAGIVRRDAVAGDARAKRIVLTEQGLASLAEGQLVRLAIEEDFRTRLGDKSFKRFRKALRVLSSAD